MDVNKVQAMEDVVRTRVSKNKIKKMNKTKKQNIVSENLHENLENVHGSEGANPLEIVNTMNDNVMTPPVCLDEQVTILKELMLSLETENNELTNQNILPLMSKGDHEIIPSVISHVPGVTESSTLELGDKRMVVYSHRSETSTEIKDTLLYDRRVTYICDEPLYGIINKLLEKNELIIATYKNFQSSHITKENFVRYCDRLQEGINVNNDQLIKSVTHAEKVMTENVNKAIDQVETLVKSNLKRLDEDLNCSFKNMQDIMDVEHETSNSLLEVQGLMQKEFEEVKEIKKYLQKQLLAFTKEVERELPKIKKRAKDREISVSESWTDEMRYELQKVVDEVKNEFKMEVNDIKVTMQNQLEVMRESLSLEMKASINFKEIQSPLENKKIEKDEGLLAFSAEVTTAIKELKDYVKEVGQKVDKIGFKIESLQADVSRLKHNLYEEIEIRGKENADMASQLDLIVSNIKETQMEVTSLDMKSNLQILDLQNEVSKFNRLLKECQVKMCKLEEKFNCNLRSDVGPEVTQVTLPKGSNRYREDVVIQKHASILFPRECYQPPIVLDDVPVVQVAPPIVNKIPVLVQTQTPEIFTKVITSSQNNKNSPQVSKESAQIRNVMEERVIIELLKREKGPVFSGENMSPPLFIKEIENYFKLIKVRRDENRLELFPTFLNGNPLEWWKLVVDKIDNWGMAKEFFMKQYFGDVDREQYKNEWRSLHYQNFSSVEGFILKALSIINTLKVNDSEAKKCERVIIKLPEPLRDYMLHISCTTIQELMYKIKEAMLFKKFDTTLYFRTQNSNSHINNSAPTGSSNSGNISANLNSSGDNQNNNCNNANFNNSQSHHPKNDNSTNNNNDGTNPAYPNMNPRYLGNPKNYIPNFRYHTANVNRASGRRGYQTRNGYQTPPRSPSRWHNAGSNSNSNLSSSNSSNIAQSNSNIVGTNPSNSLGVSRAIAAHPPTHPSFSSTQPHHHYHFNFNADVLDGKDKTLSTTIPM